MLLLALALLSVAAGDSTLECKPTGFCECVVSGLSSGLAKVDLRPIFEDGPLEITDENPQAVYTYNGCQAQSCGAHQEDTMAVCQTVGNTTFGLGQLQNVTFDISGSNPANNFWLILVTYGNGDTDLGPERNKTRVSQIRFIYNETFSVPKFNLYGEDTSQLHYFFTVHSNAVIPRRPSSAASTTSVAVWIITGLVILALMIAAAGLAAFITWRCHKRRGYRRLQGEDSAEAIQQQQQHMNVDGTMKWTLLSKVAYSN